MRNIFFLFILLPLMAFSRSEVPYSEDLSHYLGTWECIDEIPDAQWVPSKFDIKKKGNTVTFTFYKRSGKVPDDFYSGPYSYEAEGKFKWEALPGANYNDIRPGQQNVFKYEFETITSEYYWGLLVTKWYYNDEGSIENSSYLLRFISKD